MSVNEPAFFLGSLVRVQSGTQSSIYPDLPLGGWTGRVCGLDGGLRLVLLSELTLAAIDVCYRERFGAGIWLPADQLEADQPEADRAEPLLLERIEAGIHARAG